MNALNNHYTSMIDQRGGYSRRAIAAIATVLAASILALLLAGCTSGPTRAEHEERIAQLEATLHATEAQRDISKSEIERLTSEISTRALSAQATEFQPADPNTPPTLEVFMAHSNGVDEGRRQMYEAFKLEVLERCQVSGCGFVVPPMSVMEINLTNNTKGN